MTRFTHFLVLTFMIPFAFGCSDDDNPVDSGDDQSGFTDTTVFNVDTGVWQTSLDASDRDQAAYFSFGSVNPVAAADNWDISFKRTNINLNGGASSEDGRSVVGAMLTEVEYDDVSIDDTVGVEWMEDEINYVIDDEHWLSYNPVTHQLEMTGNVFTMVDAEADNFIKFTVDSLVGAGMPPAMGTVWMSYFYQSQANATTLNGAVQTASIPVGSGWGYFDFSAGQAVSPGNPQSSTNWDLAFHSYEIAQNSGPNGPGQCAAFPAFGEMSEPTDIESLLRHPSGAPLFPDYVTSVFNGDLTDDEAQWYDYNPTTHQISARDRVYLVKTETANYKLQIGSYYANINGVPTSGYYAFVWNEL